MQHAIAQQTTSHARSILKMANSHGYQNARGLESSTDYSTRLQSRYVSTNDDTCWPKQPTTMTTT